MTEAEWMLSDRPQEMVPLLCGKGSRRKLRWFAIACCVRVVPLIASKDLALAERFRYAVKTCECEEESSNSQDQDPFLQLRSMDLHTLMKENPGASAKAAAEAIEALFNSLRRDPRLYFGSDRYGVATKWEISDVARIIQAATESIKCSAREDWNTVRDLERLRLANLIRDIFANIFRQPPMISPDLLAWNECSILKIAQSIYDDRAFDRLPILADALEDAGCDNADILNHCRQPGEHVRGCWVVDLLLGKE